jgi:hypothetical protein
MSGASDHNSYKELVGLWELLNLYIDKWIIYPKGLVGPVPENVPIWTLILKS